MVVLSEIPVQISLIACYFNYRKWWSTKSIRPWNGILFLKLDSMEKLRYNLHMWKFTLFKCRAWWILSNVGNYLNTTAVKMYGISITPDVSIMTFFIQYPHFIPGFWQTLIWFCPYKFVLQNITKKMESCSPLCGLFYYDGF